MTALPAPDWRPSQWALVANLWADGHGTDYIAWFMRCDEATVYNRMDMIKALARAGR